MPTFPGGVGGGPRPPATAHPPWGNVGKIFFFFDFRTQDPEKPGLRCTCKKNFAHFFVRGGPGTGKVTHFFYVQYIRGLLVYYLCRNCLCSFTLTRFYCFLYIYTYFYYRGSIIMPNLCKFTIWIIHKFKKNLL